MSEEAKHTEGPWELDGTGDIIRTKTGVNDRGGMTGGVCVAQFWTRPSREDARLMVAAPDMLAALKPIADVLGYTEWATPEHAEEILRELIAKCHGRARAAISKAEGRS